MVCDEEPQSLHAVEQHAKVVKETFAVEKVVWGELKGLKQLRKSFWGVGNSSTHQEIPRKTSEPRQTMDTVNLVTDWNDFLETFDLHCECLKLKIFMYFSVIFKIDHSRLSLKLVVRLQSSDRNPRSWWKWKSLESPNFSIWKFNKSICWLSFLDPLPLPPLTPFSPQHQSTKLKFNPPNFLSSRISRYAIYRSSLWNAQETADVMSVNKEKFRRFNFPLARRCLRNSRLQIGGELTTV